MVRDYADYLDQVFDGRLALLDAQFAIDSKNLTDIGSVIATLNAGILEQQDQIDYAGYFALKNEIIYKIQRDSAENIGIEYEYLQNKNVWEKEIALNKIRTCMHIIEMDTYG